MGKYDYDLLAIRSGNAGLFCVWHLGIPALKYKDLIIIIFMVYLSAG
jgi:hypothetical protein